MYFKWKNPRIITNASIKSNYAGLSNYLIYNAAMHAKNMNLDVLHLGGGNMNLKKICYLNLKKRCLLMSINFLLDKE